MKDLSTIEMSGDKVPILCTLSVLEEIQKEFGTLEEFSAKLLPMKDGEDGKKEPSGKLPDIHCIYFALPLFVKEGIAAYNEHHQIKIPEMSKEQLFRMCDQPLLLTSISIYNEFWRSINAPKLKPPSETN